MCNGVNPSLTHGQIIAEGGGGRGSEGKGEEGWGVGVVVVNVNGSWINGYHITDILFNGYI